ncbi:MAG: flagellar hook-length control protein FliK [Treponema sp.]|nr:flagellar hook-length control protein FliK [Treponema sp.]
MQSLSSDILLSTVDSNLVQNLDVKNLQTSELNLPENSKSFSEYLSEAEDKNIQIPEAQENVKDNQDVQKDNSSSAVKDEKNAEKEEKTSKKSEKSEKKHNSKSVESEENLKSLNNEHKSDKKSLKLPDEEKQNVHASLKESVQTNKFTDTENKINIENASEIKPKANEHQQKITVTDLRTKNTDEKTNNDASVKTQVKFTGEKTATVTMDFTEQLAKENMLLENNQIVAAEKSDFQAMVSTQIQNSVPEFVKTGSIILKDNDKATINLVLHPDEIGNIKVNLSMDGKTLSGHIIVATKEALEVFKDNAHTLREAFAKQGFDVSDFNVSYDNNSGSNGQNFEENYYPDTYSAKKAYSSINFADEKFETDFSDVKITDFYINIVA